MDMNLSLRKYTAIVFTDFIPEKNIITQSEVSCVERQRWIPMTLLFRVACLTRPHICRTLMHSKAVFFLFPKRQRQLKANLDCPDTHKLIN
jgi:hypothetical protein